MKVLESGTTSVLVRGSVLLPLVLPMFGVALVLVPWAWVSSWVRLRLVLRLGWGSSWGGLGVYSDVSIPPDLVPQESFFLPPDVFVHANPLSSSLFR